MKGSTRLRRFCWLEMDISHGHGPVAHVGASNGKIVGQKARFKVKDIGALRVRLQMEGSVREPALFNSGIDSKLRAVQRLPGHSRLECKVATVRRRDDERPSPVPTSRLAITEPNPQRVKHRGWSQRASG